MKHVFTQEKVNLKASSVSKLSNNNTDQIMPDSIYLYGAGGHGKAIIDLLVSELDVEIKGIYDDNKTIKSLLNYPVSRVDEEIFDSNRNYHICIGNNQIRKRIAESLNGTFPTLIHPSSVVSQFSSVMDGTVVFALSSIKAVTNIGKHCIINAGSIIGHDVVIEDFVHVAPNAAIAGFVNVREGAHICIGASIVQGVTIGKWAVVGAGATVVKDVPDYAVVVGTPARILKYVKDHSTLHLG